MPVNNTSSCLVARAVPGSLPPTNNENALVTAANSVDALTDNLKKLTVQNSTSVSASNTSGTTKKSSRTGGTITPADFVTLQSLRSSALAKKTNTTSKFGRDGANLFADLLATSEEDVKPAAKPKSEKKEEKKEEKADDAKAEKKDEDKKEDAKDEKDAKEDDDLLSRGPVYAARASVGFHPYDKRGAVYGIAPQSAVDDPTSYSAAYGCGYECGTQNWWTGSRELLSNSSTPDTVKSDAGYSSATSPQHPGSSSSYGNSPALNSADLSRLLAGDKDNSELPDALSDFILKYSRRYANPDKYERRRQGSGSDDSCCGDASPKAERPFSNVGPCDSPLSAVSAPQSSPAAPHSAVSGPNTPINECFESRTGPYKLQLGQTGPEPMQRAAKDRLRKMIRDEDMDEAWAWTCKCMQYFPGALCYQDTDRDTLLHIVTSHMDLAKIYALVEQMIKTEASTSSRKPYDMPNRHGETPLFLAVEKRRNEVVDYFLEAGSHPNIQTLRQERDAPLHYAAARGMATIVQTICSYASTDVNLMNGMGLTPLLCAVRNHGVLEEESQCLINNIPTIQTLLRYNADPLIPDATNGKTVIHYAVEKMDPELIEVFQAHLDEETMTTLVNKPDLCMETPMRSIQVLNVDEQTRSRLCLILLTCGASADSSSQTQSYPQY